MNYNGTLGAKIEKLEDIKKMVDKRKSLIRKTRTGYDVKPAAVYYNQSMANVSNIISSGLYEYVKPEIQKPAKKRSYSKRKHGKIPAIEEMLRILIIEDNNDYRGFVYNVLYSLDKKMCDNILEQTNNLHDIGSIESVLERL